MNNKGFTIVELLITLVIVAVVMGYGMPTLRAVIKNNRVTTQANEIIADLNFARSEAIKRESRIVMCGSSNSTGNAPTCLAGGNWETGRIIFIDADNDNDFKGGDTLLRARNPTGIDDMTIRGNDAEMTNFIAYTRRGMTTLSAGTHYFKVCDDRGPAFARAVMVDATGRGSVVRNSNAAALLGLACP